MRKVYIAEVIDNNDPEKLGRVKIYIEPFMNGYKEEHYNWALPSSEYGTGGGSSDFGSSHIPEIGTKLYVHFADDDYKDDAFYVTDVHLKGLNPHGLFENDIKKNISGWSSNYPDVKFDIYKNGICIGISSNPDTPEVVLSHPSGFQLFINKDGKIHCKNNNSDLKVLLTDIHTLLTNILTVSNWKGNQGAPLVYNKPDDISNVAPNILTQINDLLI